MTSTWGNCDKDINKLLRQAAAQGAVIVKRGSHIIVKAGDGHGMVSVNSSNANPRIYRDVRSDLIRAGWNITK